MNRSNLELRKFIKGKAMRYLPGMITCQQFEDLIVRYLDGALDKAQRRKFEWHIRLCRECREYLCEYQNTIELGKTAFISRDPSGSEDVPEDLIKKIIDTHKYKNR